MLNNMDKTIMTAMKTRMTLMTAGTVALAPR